MTFMTGVNIKKIITVPEHIQKNITIEDRHEIRDRNRWVRTNFLSGKFEFHSVRIRTSVFIRKRVEGQIDDKDLFLFFNDGYWYFSFGNEENFTENMEVEGSYRIQSEGEFFSQSIHF